MTPDKVCVVLMREMVSLGHFWRMDWSDFDGRTLRNQLDTLSKWAERALLGETEDEFTEYSQMLNERENE